MRLHVNACPEPACLVVAELIRSDRFSISLRTEAGWKLHNRLDTTLPVFAQAAPSPASCSGPRPPRAIPQRGFYFCSGDYYVRLVEELRPFEGRASEPLGVRAEAGDRPDVGAAHPGRGLTVVVRSARSHGKNGVHRTHTIKAFERRTSLRQPGRGVQCISGRPRGGRSGPDRNTKAGGDPNVDGHGYAILGHLKGKTHSV